MNKNQIQTYSNLILKVVGQNSPTVLTLPNVPFHMLLVVADESHWQLMQVFADVVARDLPFGIVRKCNSTERNVMWPCDVNIIIIDVNHVHYL